MFLGNTRATSVTREKKENRKSNRITFSVVPTSANVTIVLFLLILERSFSLRVWEWGEQQCAFLLLLFCNFLALLVHCYNYYLYALAAVLIFW